MYNYWWTLRTISKRICRANQILFAQNLVKKKTTKRL